ncbi:tol-pal system YbgF family protein [Aliikangiella sp. G2MR2-5]|uniref:tetratricopeptide repeat protein n=1 Tax=Aliikangiella sp. G2MR2-5 TaxID=2788943 RepID=UPI0018A8DE49|nr:hypothetical protein [Aliikangiella sp. G2MR2-5]
MIRLSLIFKAAPVLAFYFFIQHYAVYASGQADTLSNNNLQSNSRVQSNSDVQSKLLDNLEQDYRLAIVKFLQVNKDLVLGEITPGRLSSPADDDSYFNTLKELTAFEDFKAAAYIYKYIDEFTRLAYHTEIPFVFRVLLKNNDLITANKLKKIVTNVGDDYLNAIVEIEFAEYYFTRNEWEQLLNTLNIDYLMLSQKLVDRSNLLKGIALQKLKRHRDSIRYYDLIESSSPFFKLAQINKAVGYLRQGWWTDGHAIIKKIIMDKPVEEQDEFTNRLYLVLGHSLLRNEYYRESRKAFRNITLDSQYLTKALMGISLVAIKQEDYKAALNALSLIKNKPNKTLEVMESYLLLPVIFQNLGQKLTANSAYETALTYFNEQLENVKKQLSKNALDSSSFFLDPVTLETRVDSLQVNLSTEVPQHLLSDYIRLQQMLSQNKSHTLKALLAKSKQKYEKVIASGILSSLEHKKAIIESYLSQTRFGLARLYDSKGE